ncbi:hypothetical protein A3C91_01230 [Candidatus Azambacteria bacterium RIFCSPHIGHO2_02_FULL_52_12]|uniref:4-alpha-glucanotransferase n=1 Tax=Candidatus Azambacteria bacterium RIFCSPLOWO2_01_FULL_46_25 TaxID=1797298 RepID=A0A1F5BV80_9BACT|nr:MAG: hypothetical protein A3C91_01230 [Candidatus Azambacteria bacterium RIFCSPHIGHO2_02_FULL_52_12]OGD34514.1 MAG: hypothetical protein A2988_03290 [Candidatus Azambacteria bacterium RIFCSPLOWO2_01_FULL_46_25]OGD36387.1 MAG: hypothetical protein A2850_01790 [Candidatus Azambacteria bacterium RIFCSPHIGHO2_01_FULL_51_74]
MRVLMFGWELPPYNSGGLGVACYHLAKALCKKNTEVIFVLPRRVDMPPQDFSILFADANMRIRTINSPLVPYITSSLYLSFMSAEARARLYGNTLFEEVLRYGRQAKKIAETETFDVIHAHDWLSFPAGVAAKSSSGKPLVVHVHATEFDRTGGQGVNPLVYEIEKWGMERADKVIAVSNFTKNMIIEKYGIAPEKIEVVYNAVERPDDPHGGVRSPVSRHKSLVLFVGRITLQKGPDYFVEAAAKVLARDRDVLFVMAGDGDMYHEMIRKAAAMGISDNFLFAGFLRGSELTALYRSADLYVMPSVSEPFGLTAIESLQCGTPILISKQTGAGESLTHCLKVDFWDTDEMAAKILAVLSYKELGQCLSEFGRREIGKFSWDRSADQCITIYQQLTTT